MIPDHSFCICTKWSPPDIHGVPTSHKKKRALTQIAGVFGQLATLEFDTIGSITEDGSVGPLLYRRVDEADGKEVSQNMQSGPFRSTSDYPSLFIDHFSRSGDVSDDVRTQLSNVRNTLTKYLESHGDKSYIRPPFRLQHPDRTGRRGGEWKSIR